MLVAVPFGLLLFLVQDKWSPLLRADDGARDELHGFALEHRPFVTAIQVLSTIGSTPVWLVLFSALVVWLVFRDLSRLALFVAVTVAGSSVLNQVVKNAVDRARPVLPDPVAHASGMGPPVGMPRAPSSGAQRSCWSSCRGCVAPGGPSRSARWS